MICTLKHQSRYREEQRLYECLHLLNPEKLKTSHDPQQKGEQDSGSLSLGRSHHHCSHHRITCGTTAGVRRAGLQVRCGREHQQETRQLLLKFLFKSLHTCEFCFGSDRRRLQKSSCNSSIVACLKEDEEEWGGVGRSGGEFQMA